VRTRDSQFRQRLLARIMELEHDGHLHRDALGPGPLKATADGLVRQYMKRVVAGLGDPRPQADVAEPEAGG
jgi:hypothetical protein